MPILELCSPDQHDQRITISSASLKNGIFEFRSDQINGMFSGKLASDHKAMSGSWKQGSVRKPLAVQLSEDKPSRE